jgi:RNA polymerase sigma factor (sigma-70 family)
MEIDTFRGNTPEQLEAWLRVIVDRTIIDLLRRSHRKKRDSGRETSIAAEGFEEPLRNASPSAQEEAARREDDQLIRRLLNELPREYREVIWLRTAGTTFKSIGKEMGRTEDDARHLHGRAFDALKKRAERLK